MKKINFILLIFIIVLFLLAEIFLVTLLISPKLIDSSSLAEAVAKTHRNLTQENIKNLNHERQKARRYTAILNTIITALIAIVGFFFALTFKRLIFIKKE